MKRPPLILLIEDDKPIVDILKEALEEEGFKLEVATDGDEGLKLAVESHPDIILLDILMPRMDGLSMLKLLRKNDWGKDANVIVITNLSNPISESEAKELMVNDYIVKSDWSLAEIIKKIKKYC